VEEKLLVLLLLFIQPILVSGQFHLCRQFFSSKMNILNKAPRHSRSLVGFLTAGHRSSPPLGLRLQIRKLTTDPANKKKLIYPDPPTSNHHDLQSFLAYVERSGLDTRSTVYVGTHYEYTIASSLARYGFSVRRVGGSSDNGIDLLGLWNIPSVEHQMKVLIQCKGGSQKVGPQLIRELEGAFVGAPTGWRGSGVLGILVCGKPATKGVRESLGRSRWPMAFISCSKDGVVQQMLWNRRAEDEGLQGIGVGMRYRESGTDAPETILTSNGKQLPLLPISYNTGNET
jgi:hypothetical protein